MVLVLRSALHKSLTHPNINSHTLTLTHTHFTYAPSYSQAPQVYVVAPRCDPFASEANMVASSVPEFLQVSVFLLASRSNCTDRDLLIL